MQSTSEASGERLKKQVYLSDNQEQRLVFAKSTLRDKINNQIVLLRRYSRNRSDVDLSDDVSYMRKRYTQNENILY